MAEENMQEEVVGEVEQPEEISLRDKTLPVDSIDKESLSQHVMGLVKKHEEDHHDYYTQREDWLACYRDLQFQRRQGPFENASDIHIPLSMIYGKATHARLWQIFGQQMNFFAVEALTESFLDREDTVRKFMNWTLTKWSNRGNGVKDVFDSWLDDIVVQGSGVVKLLWDKYNISYMDVVEEAEIVEETEFNPETFSSDIIEKVKFKEVEKERNETKQAPKIARVMIEDFFIPPGFENVNDAPWVAQRVFMTDEDMKIRAQNGKFDSEVVEEVIDQRTTRFNYTSTTRSDLKSVAADLEGVRTKSSAEDAVSFQNENHAVIEWYGKAYVTKKVDDEVINDIDELPKEIVMWVHEQTGKVLGWTYLHRISPSGRRPFYKADFIRSKYRSYGTGVAELLFSINNHIDAVHNLKLDNGILASTQFGFYRAGSTIKPDTIRIQPGELRPLEDVNDVKFVQFPYLGSFGQAEEGVLTSYAERMLAIGDIQLGQTQGVAGAVRNATGANLISRESQIQLNIHFDRLARVLNIMLRDLFIMCRERMPAALVYRVTGENGQPVFGKVNREDLKGDWDFDISVDLLAASESEKQQRATLLVQTLLNPALMQSGVVSQDNVYNIIRNLIKTQGIKRIDDFISKPQGYTGPKLTTNERIFRIVTGNINNPLIEKTVRLDEDHNAALEDLQRFMDSEMFGLLVEDEQKAAFRNLMSEHARMGAAQGGNTMPNRSGVQIPTQGLQPLEAMQAGEQMPDQGPLGEQGGMARGPVV
jgi:hypothetical protein